VPPLIMAFLPLNRRPVPLPNRSFILSGPHCWCAENTSHYQQSWIYNSGYRR
jgi:uncharacterized membrane protein YoaT (DUF817 family)